MWKRFARCLHCPLCKSALELSVVVETAAAVAPEHRALATARGLLDPDFGLDVEVGALLCRPCRHWFPVTRGLPVLLPYRTPLSEHFARDCGAHLARVAPGYTAPDREPVPGERFVMSSFSVEWLEYDFDGVIWEMSYEDHDRRFQSELGRYAPRAGDGMFLELGCGIGITTSLAHERYGVDAVGVDLSLAALRAAARYRANPFLHFVQASVFHLPFAPETFQVVYSRGVLHHTYSTREAFRALATYCRPGGSLYLWVYGPGSVDDNAFRRVLYGAEKVVRRALRGRSGGLAKVILAPVALGYLAFNGIRHWRSPVIQRYNFRRALHAARDRFTPEYAHRQDEREVAGWFREAGFEEVEVVDWRTMPPADHDDYRRNTGVRGRRRQDAVVGGAAARRR
jgi:SAM-dependent methyltransferase/uncharacterized protein YbaR (Trm112 family)